MTTKIVNGFEHLYTLLEGEKWAKYKDFIIIIHPDREPRIIYKNGNIETLKLHK